MLRRFYEDVLMFLLLVVIVIFATIIGGLMRLMTRNKDGML